MKIEDLLVHLQITTFIGASVGATHYYGSLYGHWNEQVELYHPLTPRQVIGLNGPDDFIRNWKAGDLYPGFDDEESLKKFAVSTWKEHFPDRKILVLGHTGYEEPKPVLDTVFDGDEDLIERAGIIVTICERIGWFDKRGNDLLMEFLIGSWEHALLSFVEKNDFIERAKEAVNHER